MLRRLGMLLFLTLLVSVGAFAQNDPLVGTWKDNLAKSTYSPGPPPKSGMTKITAVPGGIRLVADFVNARGQATRTSFTVKFDGKDYPDKLTIGGKPNPANNGRTVAWKKNDDYTYGGTDKIKGQVMTTSHIVISPDGKTITRTVTGKNAQGQTENNMIVSEKQ